ncbi:hypothetical protein BU15DRAFT_65567 [Melanogaster broomeanus]|nr:hypothetical protein BU15DRAFT_65567 [Melanogaster broomeanus]
MFNASPCILSPLAQCSTSRTEHAVYKHFTAFARSATLDNDWKNAIVMEWHGLLVQLSAWAKCMPDDCEGLEEQKEQWVGRWTNITDKMGSLVARAKDVELVLQMSDDQMRRMSVADGICARWKRGLQERRAERAARANEPLPREGSPMHEDAEVGTRHYTWAATSRRSIGLRGRKQMRLLAATGPSYEGSEGSSDIQFVSSNSRGKRKARASSVHDKLLEDVKYRTLSLEAIIKNVQAIIAGIARDLGDLSSVLAQLRGSE